jgi:hypothetical protein
MKRSFINLVSSILIAVLLTTAFGCYGSFQMINKVYKFNGGLGSKFVNELGFLVMIVVPVYGVAGFVDAVVLNTIEFWTGTNPMTQNDGTQTISLPDGNLTMKNADGTYQFKQIINGNVECVRVETRGGNTVAYDQAGNILARSVRNADGGVTVFDASGVVVSSLSKTQVESMVAVQ